MPADRPPLGARVAAGIALIAFGVAVIAVLSYIGRHLGAVVIAALAIGLAVPLVWSAATRHRFRVLLAVAALAVFAAGVAVLITDGGGFLELAVLVVVVSISAGAGALALRWEVAAAVGRRWSPAPPARQPVLLMNPKSGGGVVERLDLAAEATRRRIEPIVLGPGDDLRALAVAAAEGGADVLGMAGGDGSQALVAAVAAEHDLGFVCVPAGTRNHLALDLGVDRADVIGSLDAFGPALQTRMDLAVVNDVVFVNNVSLGVYAEVVASDEYRDNKLKTAAGMLPDLLGTEAKPSGLHVHAPDATEVDDPQVVMVSNNPYRLERLAGFGTRAHLDRGVLGVAAVRIDNASGAARFVAAEAAGRLDQFSGWQSWEPQTLDITSSGPVAAGVDGESMTLQSPLHFEIRPMALTARLAPHHPGSSPAARRAGPGRTTFLGLARVLAGRPSGLVV